MEMVLVLIAFIVGGTVALLLIDGVSDVAARALVGAFGRLRRERRMQADTSTEPAQ
ncbi:hypothetical protein [Agrococcus beijingensis]|uniref:hypothetical protein n=1 Tax=Agrococcus beijingensis TaxID=3068634 RepID=UPI0027421C16|nr:hypothetical protein [Agrococcus sp. REN33]